MIVYASRTGNVRYAVSKLQLQAVPLVANLCVQQRFILFTYTDALGAVPDEVVQFMQQHYSRCVGIFASGNRNFGEHFARAGNILAAQYDIPLLKKIELRGSARDYEEMRALYDELMTKKVGM